MKRKGSFYRGFFYSYAMGGWRFYSISCNIFPDSFRIFPLKKKNLFLTRYQREHHSIWIIAYQLATLFLKCLPGRNNKTVNHGNLWANSRAHKTVQMWPKSLTKSNHWYTPRGGRGGRAPHSSLFLARTAARWDFDLRCRLKSFCPTLAPHSQSTFFTTFTMWLFRWFERAWRVLNVKEPI